MLRRLVCTEMLTYGGYMNQIFYVVYCVLCYVEYFPKLFRLLKTKSSNDYSIVSTIMSLTGMFCWVVYLYSTEQDLILYIGAAVDIILNITFATLIFKYHKNKEVSQNEKED